MVSVCSRSCRSVGWTDMQQAQDTTWVIHADLNGYYVRRLRRVVMPCCGWAGGAHRAAAAGAAAGEHRRRGHRGRPAEAAAGHSLAAHALPYQSTLTEHRAARHEPRRKLYVCRYSYQACRFGLLPVIPSRSAARVLPLQHIAALGMCPTPAGARGHVCSNPDRCDCNAQPGTSWYA